MLDIFEQVQQKNYHPVQAKNMIELPGYEIVEQLYVGSQTIVYRGRRLSDSSVAVIKLLNNPYPTFNQLLQFRNQYTIAKNLNLSGIIRPYSLESSGNTYALIMEDCGSVSLRDYTRDGRLAIAEVLEIAVQVAQILYELHQNRVIHKDIKPANILIHPDTKQVKLIDFSIASLLPKETEEIKNPNVLEGTLAYLAPEQTGRMNRGIDYRSDFYALGVTLYQLLTGKLPFESKDPMELVHCHIAKQPPALQQSNSEEIPSVLADIVMKLMAKNAEDRYQSALGLKYDLEICLNQLKEKGKIEVFEIGQRDLCDRFLIPEKLYGRETEVQTLLDAFDRVASGSSELMLVAGFSGIGKTAVVNEVHKPIVRQQGYFIKGKFDQFNRNIPFSAFVQALCNLMGQLLSESDAQLQQWKTQILEALGENGQVLIEVVPELEQAIGKQPPAPELSGSAAQNRFNLLFQKFIEVFATPDHPLVIFLDDLQWADSASLQLIKVLMNGNGYLLMLGAYRDNEVSPVHPFVVTVDELQKSQVVVNAIALAPLALADTNRLIADTLNCPEQLAQPLTELIARKTKGNPFFTTQFLKALYEDGLITFDVDRRYWICDIAQIGALAIADDVVEFMALQLQKLPEQTQQVLKLAACVGNQFDLNTLAIVCEQSLTDAATALWKALQEGSILPTNQIYKFFQGAELPNAESANPQYRFLHDRVQQAAYSLIPEERKQVTHWKIGQLLLKQKSQHEQVEQIFDIVNQLNLGKATISDPAHKYQLAQLNLQAGQKAKLSAAYQAAQNYCEIGIDTLPAEAWQVDYTLTYELHRHASEAAYLCGNFDRAEILYATTLSQAQTPLDKAVIYRVQMTQYQLQGRNGEAIAIQRQSLQLLGWTVPTTPETIQAGLDEQIAIVNRFLEQQSIESILGLPEMEDENIAEILRILQILFYAAWYDGQPLLSLLGIAKVTTLSLQYGNSDMSPFGYVGYGLIAITLLKNAAQAYQFGDMAVRLCEQFDNADVRGMTNFLFASDVHSWSRPLREADIYYENGFKYGMDAGNWLTVTFMVMQSGSDRLTYGKNLDELYAIAQTHADFLYQIKSLDNLDAFTAGVLQPIRHLLGLTPSTLSFDSEAFNEAEYLQKYQDTPYHLAWLYSVKIRHAFLFQQQTTYLTLIPQLKIIEETIPTHAKVPSSVFYVILMHLALIETAQDEAQRQFHWQAILPLEERLIRWEQDCPANIQHKCLLVQAEKARLSGHKSEAIDLYDRSIAQAEARGYGCEAAIANELAAKFYLNWGKEKVAAGYMQEAYYCYAQWGATAKVNDLEQRYPDLLRPVLEKAQSFHLLETLATVSEAIPKAIAAPYCSIHTSTQTNRSSGSSSVNASLDFASILKASRSLSSTIQLDDLLHQLTGIILQNSGADRCALILPNTAGEWEVRATATLEDTQLCHVPLQDNPDLPIKLIYYVKNTKAVAIVNDCKTDLPVIDNYLERRRPQSILCLPILNQGNSIGILYLQNGLARGVFTRDRMETLQLLTGQAAIALENARLYQQVESYSQTLEAEVERKTQALQQALQQVQQTQAQLIHTEKMSSLGQMVAGIAHEINNPINFIKGNIGHTQDYFADLVSLLSLYQQEYPQPTDEIAAKREEIELDFLIEDVSRILGSMKTGSDRIQQIVLSLRNFARLDEADLKNVDIHEGIESTLLIVRRRCQPSGKQPEIQVIKDYGKLPAVTCYPSQLNQVFMQIFNNAIDAIRENPTSDITPEIRIRTGITESGLIRIQIANTHSFIPEEIQTQIFNPFFTTKPVGKGTGLGLSVSYAIIQKHQGTLTVRSHPGEGTEFEMTIAQKVYSDTLSKSTS